MKKDKAIAPEVVYSVETWKSDEFSTQLIDLKRPPATLDRVGKIMFYHTLTMEAGKVSIAAALMTALELYKAQGDHPREFESWCEANLQRGNIKIGRSTVYKYLAMLKKTVGPNCSLEDLSHDTEQGKLEAVATFTKYTHYQSLYQLYNGEGIVKKSKMGGDRPGAGRKRKEDLAAQAEQQAAELGAESIKQRVSDLYTAAIIQGGLGNCKNEDLAKVRDMFKLLLKEAEEILKSRKGK